MSERERRASDLTAAEDGATARYGATSVIAGGAVIMLAAMAIAFASREIRTMRM